jgi:predicted dehydrogenase
MSQQPLRWGILSTANIAKKNWKAIRHSGNSTLIAVASRDRERAQKFIDECQSSAPFAPAPSACANYADLLARKDVDAVYIPLPTGVRKDWVIRAAEAGKHILCEKPCGVDAAEVRAMLDACTKNGVQFMDGVMFMHSRRLPLIHQILDDGRSIGTIRRITSQFSFMAPEEFLKGNIRVSHELEPLGALGDLGWYNIRFALWVMKYQMPHSVSGRLLAQHARQDSHKPVPLEFSGELFFPGGVSGSFYCSFQTENQQWANVSGTKGYLHVPDFVVPFFGCETAFDVQNAELHVYGCDFNMESHLRRPAVHEYGNGAANAQETNMIRSFAQQIASGQLDPKWGNISLITQQVLDACLQSSRQDGKLIRLS